MFSAATDDDDDDDDAAAAAAAAADDDDDELAEVADANANAPCRTFNVHGISVTETIMNNW